MTLLWALNLVLLVSVLGFGPGFYFVRKLRWNNSETIVSSIGLSILLIYFVATAIYLLNISWNWCWLTTAAGIALTALSWRDLGTLFRKRSVRRLFAGFAFLFVVGLLMLSL